MVKVAKSISLSEELLQDIDEKRQLISRSVYVEFLLKKALGEKEDGSS
jgi:metal-responsive CopG/Arc/MetJ family transcriptional regulator